MSRCEPWRELVIGCDCFLSFGSYDVLQSQLTGWGVLYALLNRSLVLDRVSQATQQGPADQAHIRPRAGENVGEVRRDCQPGDLPQLNLPYDGEL